MCQNCDYRTMFRTAGLDATGRRISVMEIVGNSPYPLSAQEVFDVVNRTRNINRVTVYRILDLLVEKGLLERISSGDRSFRFGIAPNRNHRRHAHFFCRRCSNMVCLNPESLSVKMDALERTFPGLIEKAEIRLDGLCKDCLKAISESE